MEDQKACDIFILLKEGKKYEHIFKNVKHRDYKGTPLTQYDVTTVEDNLKALEFTPLMSRIFDRIVADMHMYRRLFDFEMEERRSIYKHIESTATADEIADILIKKAF
jgi:hypothetical protein